VKLLTIGEFARGSRLSAKATGSATRGRPTFRCSKPCPGTGTLLCSDGLSSVVPAPEIRAALAGPGSSPEEVVSRLRALANESGGSDNVACVVANTIQPA
jgi:protein phosphatase